MVKFERYKDSALYTSSSNTAVFGWWGFLITKELHELPKGPISLADALGNEEWKGTLVYVAANATKIPENAQGFIKQIIAILDQYFNDGALIFLPSGEIDEINPQKLKTVIPLSRAGKVTPNSAPTVTLTGLAGVSADINPQVELSVPPEGDNEYILFRPTGSNAAVTLGGPLAPTVGIPPDLTAKLHFAGSANGAFSFSLLINENSLNPALNLGFQVLIPNPKPNGDDVVPQLAALLPLAEASPQSLTTVGFSAQVNIVNPNNQVAQASPTVFYFTGMNGLRSEQPNTKLSSYYRTNYGKKVTLIPVVDAADGQQPAGLVINPGYRQTTLPQNGFRFSPVGDFKMVVEKAEPGQPQKLLCGLSGTETIAFRPEIDGNQAGTRLRFASNRPANASQFPLKAVSPVGPPIDPKACLLDSRYETSWASLVTGPAKPSRRSVAADLSWPAHYSAAPKGAELFGKIDGGLADSGLLNPCDPGVTLDGSVVFPMFPFAGFKGADGVQDPTSGQLELLERQILSPTRKGAINSAHPKSSRSAHVSLFPQIARVATDGDGLTNTTTPTGFITRYSSDGTWKQLLLSQVQEQSGSVTRQMGFTDLQADLQAAFQTSDQFLIIANNKSLGTPAFGAFMPPSHEDIYDKKLFYNAINIGKWNFRVQTGEKNKYGDYRDVIIVKGVKGKIFDIDPSTKEVSKDSLVLSPEKWTMKDTFAAPNPPDLSELVQLSNWLVDYCQAAYDKRDNPFFANFVKIIKAENWMGVLILKAEVENVPTDLAGILAGVKDPSDFYAHHIGIEIGQIEGKKVEQTDSSSMFGLVYYVDPRYDDTSEPHTIAPGDLSAPYDFSLLTLKTLFQNSAITKFESLAQIALNQICGSNVTEMVDEKPEGPQPNPYNALLLQGGVQKNGDAVVYSLSSKWPDRYSLANNVLKSVEIDTAQMSTRDDGVKSGQIVSWIGMSGFMNLAIIPAIKADNPEDSLPAFDIFSFGPDEGQENTLRQGLNFNNLGLQITIPPQVAGEDPPPPILAMVDNEIAFNSSGSHVREKSLYRNFQLQLLGLVSGNAKAEEKEKKSDPNSLGYLPVITQYNLRGVSSGAGGWHGLKFKLNLGTPGALAGKVNLDSSLLVAWADDSGHGGSDGSGDFQAMVGIELPGAGGGGELFSLQTVIKLSIGLIQLMYAPPVEGDEGKKGGFLLVMNQIALKLLGLEKIPPSGNVAFLLFGDPEAADSTGLGWFAMYKQDSKEQSRVTSDGSLEDSNVRKD
jgi:hypothetical protein